MIFFFFYYLLTNRVTVLHLIFLLIGLVIENLKLFFRIYFFFSTKLQKYHNELMHTKKISSIFKNFYFSIIWVRQEKISGWGESINLFLFSGLQFHGHASNTISPYLHLLVVPSSSYVRKCHSFLRSQTILCCCCCFMGLWPDKDRGGKWSHLN